MLSIFLYTTEREVYIEELLHTLAAKEVDIIELGKELATVQTKSQQKDELIAIERERMQKLEQELAQRLELDKTGTNLRSAIQEILRRVSTESVSKSGTLVTLH